MGNCCGGDADSDIHGTNTRAFAGPGHRLGRTNERSNYGYGTTPLPGPEKMPSPAVDPDLDEADRGRIRAERAAAAEKRLKAAGGDKKKKKKKKDSSPLRGPNSTNLMQWNVG